MTKIYRVTKAERENNLNKLQFIKKKKWLPNKENLIKVYEYRVLVC